MEDNYFETTLNFELRYDANGLVPVATQDSRTKEVLILSFANREAVEKTLETRLATYWSRSRNELWIKGAGKTGDYLEVGNVLINCEQNSLVYQITPLRKGACHTKDLKGNTRPSCYYRTVKNDNGIYSLEFI